MTCHVPGCMRPTTRYGRHCNHHKAAQRRHGHPLQKGVTKEDLKPYVHPVEARMAKNPQSTVWATCEARWSALAGQAAAILKRSATGATGRRSEHTAAAQVVRLAENVEPRTVVVTALAMYLMQDHEPRRFLSDETFLRQLTRRIIRLTEVNAGEWFNDATGRMQRAYRELPPEAADIIAEWIVEALGPVGLHLARLEQRDMEERQRGKADFGAALAELS